ncbi:MAG: nickel pincer cofactor biosynthesis protein LarC [Scytolyngbya sp. HA4215-MV1]|jgi:hypothetical protein|nr:nickel pincer cofactor biosynthesis protein LarC [Scytolyngbya sp. HA4215-MV1]
MQKKMAYLECPTGVAGDMCLGALIHAGVPLEYLMDQLSRLGISEEYQLAVELVQRRGQQATKLHVQLTDLGKGTERSPTISNLYPSAHATPDHAHPHPHIHHHHSQAPAHPHPEDQLSELKQQTSASAKPDLHPHPTGTRHLPEIEQLILAAKLPTRAEAWSLAVFRQLAAAEAAVHGIPADRVHFHEVGATDAIVDIVGTCLGLDWLAIDQLYCSALPTGGGTVWAAHGRLPVPTPAVLKLWEMRQVPIYSNGIDRELVTPTGAAIVTTLATRFGAPPSMTLHRVGLGAGSQDLAIPNIVRLWLGEGVGEKEDTEMLGRADGKEEEMGESARRAIENPNSAIENLDSESIAVLETQIDDLNPQAIGYVFEALFAVGAVDVFTQAIGMKKCRPGILLTVICPLEQIDACQAVMFRETTTLGIRRSTQQRSILKRQLHSIETEYGRVRVKVAWAGDRSSVPSHVQPEYEDCAAIAQQHNLPWRQIHRVALQSWYTSQRGRGVEE